MRVINHPILGSIGGSLNYVKIRVDDETIEAIEGEPIAAALMAAGKKKFRSTVKYHHPRGVFCAIGRCTDCAMTVNGVPNVRTCVTRVREGTIIETQDGLGKWGEH